MNAHDDAAPPARRDTSRTRTKRESYADDEAAAQVRSDKSRSLKKRESSALQERGEFLAGLSPSVWNTLPLDAELRAALDEWRGLKSREARRRHLQYIGRLMRELDEATRLALLAALEELQATQRGAAGGLHALEDLRSSLLQPDAQARERALEGLLSADTGLEEARLRHLIRAALADREKQRPPRHARELFRYLRTALERTPQSS